EPLVELTPLHEVVPPSGRMRNGTYGREPRPRAKPSPTKPAAEKPPTVQKGQGRAAPPRSGAGGQAPRSGENRNGDPKEAADQPAGDDEVAIAHAQVLLTVEQMDAPVRQMADIRVGHRPEEIGTRDDHPVVGIGEPLTLQPRPEVSPDVEQQRSHSDLGVSLVLHAPEEVLARPEQCPPARVADLAVVHLGPVVGLRGAPDELRALVERVI